MSNLPVLNLEKILLHKQDLCEVQGLYEDLCEGLSSHKDKRV
jgi:hypothetical protein